MNELFEKRDPSGDERYPAGDEEDRVCAAVVLRAPFVEAEADALLDRQATLVEMNPRNRYRIHLFPHIRRLAR